jgi:hypothetical protein
VESSRFHPVQPFRRWYRAGELSCASSEDDNMHIIRLSTALIVDIREDSGVFILSQAANDRLQRRIERDLLRRNARSVHKRLPHHSGGAAIQEQRSCG